MWQKETVSSFVADYFGVTWRHFADFTCFRILHMCLGPLYLLLELLFL